MSESTNKTLGELLLELKTRVNLHPDNDNPRLVSSLQEAHEVMWSMLHQQNSNSEKPKFSDTDDRPGVSDRLVLLYALSLVKSLLNQPDAQVSVSACANLLKLEKIRMKQNRDKKILAANERYEEIRQHKKMLEADGWMDCEREQWKLDRGFFQDHVITDTCVGICGKRVYIKIAKRDSIGSP